jgi:hypothetical protein
MLKGKQTTRTLHCLYRIAALDQRMPFFFIAAQNIWNDEKGIYCVHLMKSLNNNNAVHVR